MDTRLRVRGFGFRVWGLGFGGLGLWCISGSTFGPWLVSGMPPANLKS